MLVTPVTPSRSRRWCSPALGTRGFSNNICVIDLVACNVVVSVLMVAFFCVKVGLHGALLSLLLPLLLLLLRLLPVLPPPCNM